VKVAHRRAPRSPMRQGGRALSALQRWALRGGNTPVEKATDSAVALELGCLDFGQAAALRADGKLVRPDAISLAEGKPWRHEIACRDAAVKGLADDPRAAVRRGSFVAVSI
jgi:hypothetical protein